MRKAWWIGFCGLLSALYLLVACSAPQISSSQTDQITPTLTQTGPLTITITTDLQATSLTNPLVLTQTEPLVWLALTKKDPEAIHLTSAEVGVEESIYPAPLLAINGLGQQTMITTETEGLIYREQGLPLPILYRPNPLPDQPFAAQVLTDHVEISWRRHFQFSPKLDYVAMRTFSLGATSLEDRNRLELINLQTGARQVLHESQGNLKVTDWFIGWTASGIYELSSINGPMSSASIRFFDPTQADPLKQSIQLSGEGGMGDTFLDIEHGLLAHGGSSWHPAFGVKNLQTETDLIIGQNTDTTDIDNLSISPDARYLAYLYHPTVSDAVEPTSGTIRLYSIEQQQPLGDLATGINPDMVRQRFDHHSSPFDPTMMLWTPDSQYLLALSCDPRTPWQWRPIGPSCDAASPIQQQRQGLVFRLADQQQLTTIVVPAHTGSIKLVSPTLLGMIAYVDNQALLIFCDIVTGRQTVPLALGKVIPVIVYPH
ncbi:hypothetical protein [Herpetosiphon giganteus]|uniref:hypothetical protein n=1 Tax=Herpetosiphon giganteus TaxID=2029754 RepID=UPI00195E1772|nr:hypothetical protein [Herpetosiphon giganteus]MBM7846453.1 hypothetical protein [Herpetosiphon giganteus]